MGGRARGGSGDGFNRKGVKVNEKLCSVTVN